MRKRACVGVQPEAVKDALMSDATLPLHLGSAHTPPGGLGEGGVYKTWP